MPRRLWSEHNTLKQKTTGLGLRADDAFVGLAEY